ncbi:hypothetical protein RCJ22_00755, partial [Vibrio sp. FNV 38]|nr:hypothetical protein [Vibrio sp. FNV 38]
MRKMLCAILAVLLTVVSAVCISPALADSAGEFQPRLDTESECTITVVGSYSNFEALEAEFDRFNKYYPNVKLTFTKVDDYNNMIGTVLNGNDAPDIYVNHSWMYGRD